MGMKLRQAGIDNFQIYEKAGEVGGTWRDNTYPGLTCDEPARFYSYSFAPNPYWSHAFAPGAEIQDYLTRTTERFGLRPHLRLDSEVTSACWDGQRWRLRTAGGHEDHVDVLVAATGVQIVTALFRIAGRLLVFQRTAQWIMPAPNRRYTRIGQALLRHVPALDQASHRIHHAVVTASRPVESGPATERGTRSTSSCSPPDSTRTPICAPSR